MQEIHSDEHQNSFDDVIDLQELFSVIFQGKWIIVSVTACFLIIGIIFSLLLPNIYVSSALLAPTNSSGSISNALRSYSGVASLAGVSLPGAGDDNNTKKAIAKISSLSFFEEDLLPEIFIPDLMALKSWDSNTNTLIYDESIYNINSNSWIGSQSNSQKQIPTAQEMFREFKNTHLRVSEDDKTGFVTISIKHQSPFVAKEWTELVVNQINSFYRQKDKLESQKAADFLYQKIATTNLSEVKQSIAELLQEETQKLTLVEANEFYVFDYIDNPAAMEKKSEPIRALICIIFLLLGGVLSIFIVLLKHYFFSEKKSPKHLYK